MPPVSLQRNAALSASIGAVICTTFSLVALHTQTSGGLKSANYLKYDHTRCEVTCDRSDPNCAREITITAWGTLKSQEERDFEAWQKCKNTCTDFDDCRGFDLTMHPEQVDNRDYYTCTLFYQFIHTCDYIKDHLCFVKECIIPAKNDPTLHPEVAKGKECYRLPHKDKWGLQNPMLWQRPVNCPAHDYFCKEEGEECGTPERQCRAGEGLVCKEDCRYNRICKREYAVQPTDLATHALLQCPFVPGTGEKVVIEPPEPAVIPPESGVYEVFQSDVQNNPLKITRPGLYKIMEDITFDFPEAPHASVSNGLHAGKIHGIEILTSNVIIDLNGKTLQMSASKSKRQRFFSLIVIGNQVFRRGQAGFTTEHVPQSHVVIKNGKLGKTSHFGIRGLDSRHVAIENVKFVEFEVAAASFQGGSHIRITGSKVDNRNIKTTLDKNFGVFFQLHRTMSMLQDKGHQDNEEPNTNRTRFPDDFFNNLNVQRLSNSTVAPDASDLPAVNAFVARQDGSSLPQGNAFGIAISSCRHVEIRNCDIRGIGSASGRVTAVKELDGDGPVFNTESNTLPYDWFWDTEGNRKDKKSNLSEKEKFEVLLFKAQVWAKVKTGQLNGINLQFVQEVLSPERPQMDYVRQWVGNDIRGHVDRGAHAISLIRSSNVLISDVTIDGVLNSSPLGLNEASTWMASRDSPFLSSEPALWRGRLESHRVTHAADAYGIRVSSGSTEVQIKKITISGVRSHTMHAFGVAVTGPASNVGVEDASVTALAGGVIDDEDLKLPNLRAKVMPFFREREQEKVVFNRISPEKMYLSPESHCNAGCPEDGNWQVDHCDTTGPSPPPVDCEGIITCDPETCVETVTHIVEAAHGGKPCPYARNATFNCCKTVPPLEPEMPVDCEGEWSQCDQECYSVFVVVTPAKFGGMLCETPAGTRNATKCLGAAGCEVIPGPDTTKPVHCQYEFVGECDENCRKQVRIIQSSQNGGMSCPTFDGMRGRADCQPGYGKCPLVPSQECVAEWSECDAGTCLKKYHISKDAFGTTNACPFKNGTLAQCATCEFVTPNTTMCLGKWSACNPWTCLSTFVVSHTATNGGSECPHQAGSTRRDDCAGNCTASPTPPTLSTCGWGECTSRCTRVYSTGGRNDCPVANGHEEPRDCRGGMGDCPLKHCEGTWSECDASCVRTFKITQAAANGGNECSQVDGAKSESDCRQNGQACPKQENINCEGHFSEECNNQCERTFIYSQLSSGSGTRCSYGAGQKTKNGCVIGHNCPSNPTSSVETHRDCVYHWSECNAQCKSHFQIISPPQAPFTICPNSTVKGCLAGEGKCLPPVCSTLSSAACKNEPLCMTQGESCVDIKCDFTEKKTCDDHLKCFWSDITNQCKENSCFRHVGEDECATDEQCFWDDDATLSHNCKPDECVVLNTEDCNKAKHCFVNVVQNNACTWTHCGISHTTVDACNTDPKCFYNTHAASCEPNVCQTITDSVQCTGINACWLDTAAQTCRPDTCRIHGEDQTGCLQRPDCVLKFVAGKAMCRPGTCILVKDEAQCDARADCVVGKQSPFECKENPCLALGLSGTVDKCNALDSCYYDGKSCAVDVCKPLEASACEADTRCLFDGSTCVADLCSNHKGDRLKCKSVPKCHFISIDFNAADLESSKSGTCVVSYCDNLSLVDCNARPSCYVDRTDRTTCRANPCNAAATNSAECTKFNSKCTWNNDRCEPFPLCSALDADKCTTPWCTKTSAGCDQAACDSITDLTVCDASTHCYRDNNDKCKENPCVNLKPAECTAHEFCELDDSIGHICKPKKPCAQMTEFYGPSANCTTNTFCHETSQNFCVAKECSQLSASACKFSESGDRRCFLSSDQTCVTNVCDSITEEQACKAAGCLFDGTATSHRCSPDLCASQSKATCANTDGCIFVSSTGLCQTAVCNTFEDSQTCQVHTFADQPIACHFNTTSNTCGLNECGAWSGQRESCNARSQCAHFVKEGASNATCEIDPCVGKGQAACTGQCVYTNGGKQCLPVTLCASIDESSCGADRFCHWNNNKCEIDLCKGHPDKGACETDTTCVFNTGKGECQTNICDIQADAVACAATTGCFFGHKDGLLSSEQGCFPDRCSSFDSASTNSTENQAACDSASHCQHRGGHCKPTKTCAWFTDCASANKITVGEDTLCETCGVDECCKLIPPPLTASESTQQITAGLSEGARGTQESTGIAGGSVALIVAGIALAFIAILGIAGFLWKKRTKKNDLSAAETDVDNQGAQPSHTHE